jgi:hypothetical protein
MAEKKKMSFGEKLHGVAHAIPGYGIAQIMKEKGEKNAKEREHIKNTRGSPKKDMPNTRHRDHSDGNHDRGYGRG